jgi:hypothetical protein
MIDWISDDLLFWVVIGYGTIVGSVIVGVICAIAEYLNNLWLSQYKKN